MAKQATFKRDQATESSGEAGSGKGYDHWTLSIFLSMWEGTRQRMTDGTFPREGGIYWAVFSQGGRSPPSLGTVRSEAGGLRFRTEKRSTG